MSSQFSLFESYPFSNSFHESALRAAIMPNLIRNNADHHSELLVAPCPEVIDSVEVLLNYRVSTLVSVIDSGRLYESLLIQLEHSDFSLRKLAIECNIESRKRRPKTWVLGRGFTDCRESQKLREFSETGDSSCSTN